MVILSTTFEDPEFLNISNRQVSSSARYNGYSGFGMFSTNLNYLNVSRTKKGYQNLRYAFSILQTVD
jgi:hypothetical protein